jgi:hypothetical protein
VGLPGCKALIVTTEKPETFMLIHVRAATMSALAAAALLGGCFGGEPSEKEMAQALHDNPKFQATVLIMAGLQRNANAEKTLAEIRKVGTVEKSACKEAQGSPGYVCDFRWGPKRPDGGVAYGAPMKGRFYKSGDAWSVDL